MSGNRYYSSVLLDVNEYLAQFLGLFIYGAANFIANKKITFQ